jgi:MtrB/PioB family decaheme-associated outer membrane protein
MTRTMCLALAAAVLAVPARAQEPAPSPSPSPAPAEMGPAFSLRRIDFGAQGVETDTNSSRFEEYRDVPTGVVIPFARFAGSGKVRYDVTAENVLQHDARYHVLAERGFFGIRAEFIKIPHRFGNEGITLLEDTGPGVLSISPTLRQTFQTALERQFAISPGGINYTFLSTLVNPSLSAETPIDLALLRERGQVEMRLTRDKPYDIRLLYFQEHRRGTRAAGTSFGFGNVVESPEPIDYRTRDFAATAEWTRKSLLLRGSFHYNDFANKNPFEEFANPFRATDSTDPSAYQAPGSASINGPAFGRVSLSPDNKAVTGAVGFLYKFNKTTRLSADATLGQWTQNDPFMPFSSNTAITTPVRAADPASLPAHSLDGKIGTFSFSSLFTTRPADHFTITARFRRYDLSNDTPRITIPGYARFDAAWQATPRISVPYGNTTDAFVASAAYDFGSLTLEGGYRYDKLDRTFRETESNSQNVGYLKADYRAADWALVRGTFEKGSRSFSGLEIERSEDATFVNPAAPTNLLAVPSATVCVGGGVCNLRYDQANKDVDRYGAYVDLSPGGKANLTFSYLKGKDRYPDTTFGLIRSDNEAISAEVDYTPRERVNLFGFYTRENIATFQRGRQSGATVSVNPLDDWTSEIDDKVDSFGAGATLGLTKEKKIELTLGVNYQKVDGNNDFESPVGGAPEVGRRTTGGITDIPFFDDTKLYTLSAELAWHVTKALRVGLGGWYEQYQLRDLNSNDISGGVVLKNYVPASFFLAAVDSDYKAHVVYVRASYLW